jgi:hypothetical protein
MADHAALRDALWEALEAEPKPVTGERVTQLARSTLPGLEAQQFDDWFTKHGDRLLEKLNVETR